jgi:hypothetical protein
MTLTSLARAAEAIYSRYRVDPTAPFSEEMREADNAVERLAERHGVEVDAVLERMYQLIEAEETTST